MQQRSQDRATRSPRSGRTQPVHPGVTAPASSVATHSLSSVDTPLTVRKRHAGRNSILLLLALGGLLELCLLALYPLLAKSSIVDDPVHQAISGLFPWLSSLYWTTTFPALVPFLANLPWLNPPGAGSGNLNLLLLFFGLACVFMLCAAHTGNRAASQQLSQGEVRALFWTVFVLIALFGVTMMFAPVITSVMSRDMLLYGLYGRMVVVYYVNPYLVTPGAFSQDILQMILDGPGGPARIVPLPPSVSTGPVWLDLSLIITLLARDSVATMLMGFRAVAFIAHLINAVLIWIILSQVKPEVRISTTLLYAWNPLVLLLGVSQVHLEIVLVLFLLLAVLFYQRNSLLLCWVFVLLAALTSPLCLVLLPLFLRLMLRKVRFLLSGYRVLWWLSMLLISALVLVLAYAPFWQDWGLMGLISGFQQVFWQSFAINSLDAALLRLPLSLPAPVLWIITPQYWSLFALVIAGVGLLFSIWLADTLDMVLLCASWLLLLLLLLQPTYWPWYGILPLVLALCSTNRSTVFLALLLTFGALLSFYWWQWPSVSVWAGQALSTIGLPFLLWGWVQFFASTWRMTRTSVPHVEQSMGGLSGFIRRSRPPWLSRPSWPSRPGRRSSL